MHRPSRATTAFLALASAVGVAVAAILFASPPDDRTGGGGAPRETAGSRALRAAELAPIDAVAPADDGATVRGPSLRVPAAEERPAPSAAVAVGERPIVETRSLLRGRAGLVDAGGRPAAPRDVRLLARVVVERPQARPSTRIHRGPPALAFETVDGHFDLTFVRREGGGFTLPNGSRPIGASPLAGRVEIFGVEAADVEVPLSLVRRGEDGVLEPVGELAFAIGTTDAEVLVRAPRVVTLDVVDAESGDPVGPVLVRAYTGSRARATLAHAAISPVDVPAGRVGRLSVEVEGYSSSVVDVREAGDAPIRVPVRRAATLEVRVLPAPGGPPPGTALAHVTLERLGAGGERERRALPPSSDLTWRVGTRPPGEYLITAWISDLEGPGSGSLAEQDHVTRSIRLRAGERRTVVVDMGVEERSEITLALTAGDGEALPARFPVVVLPADPPGERRELMVRAERGDATSSASLGAWPAGRYRVEVLAGRGFVHVEHLTREEPTVARIDLRDWRLWELRFLDPATDAPAPVQVLRVDVGPAPGGTLVVRPDADGVFRFSAPLATRGCECRIVGEGRVFTRRVGLPDHAPGVLEVALRGNPRADAEEGAGKRRSSLLPVRPIR